MVRRIYTALMAACFVGIVATHGDAAVTVYTDESAYLSARNGLGYSTLIEDFEGTVWDSVRTTIIDGKQTAPSILSHGITWSATDAVTTSEGAARTGWGAYDHPGGDPDILYGTAARTLYGLGGWFHTNTPFTTIQIFLDGVPVDNGSIQLDSQHRFLGVIDTDGFTAFEIRDTDATPEDQKHWFCDDFTFAVLPQVPAVSTWGLIALASVLVGAGVIITRRRRVQRAC